MRSKLKANSRVNRRNKVRGRGWKGRKWNDENSSSRHFEQSHNEGSLAWYCLYRMNNRLCLCFELFLKKKKKEREKANNKYRIKNSGTYLLINGKSSNYSSSVENESHGWLFKFNFGMSIGWSRVRAGIVTKYSWRFHFRFSWLKLCLFIYSRLNFIRKGASMQWPIIRYLFQNSYWPGKHNLEILLLPSLKLWVIEKK